MNSLVQSIQRTAMDAVLANMGSDVYIGKVKSVDPLEISIGSGIVVEGKDLLLSPLVQDMNVSMVISANTSQTSVTQRHRHNYATEEGDNYYLKYTSQEELIENGAVVSPANGMDPFGDGRQPNSYSSMSHSHMLAGEFDVVLRFGLDVNDIVIMQSFSGGQRFVVLFKVTAGATEQAEESNE